MPIAEASADRNHSAALLDSAWEGRNSAREMCEQQLATQSVTCHAVEVAPHLTGRMQVARPTLARVSFLPITPDVRCSRKTVSPQASAQDGFLRNRQSVRGNSTQLSSRREALNVRLTSWNHFIQLRASLRARLGKHVPVSGPSAPICRKLRYGNPSEFFINIPRASARYRSSIQASHRMYMHADIRSFRSVHQEGLTSVSRIAAGREKTLDRRA